MVANVLKINARKKQSWVDIAGPKDFEWSQGPEVDPQVILRNPNISLYCLDHGSRRAIFLQTTPGIDITEAPFFYQAQYDNAVNGYALPYEMLHRMADGIKIDPTKLVMIYSTGRAGSTLVGKAFNAVDGIVGLSEPDVFTQLTALRISKAGSDQEMGALAASCLKFQCKPTEQVPEPAGWAIKFRSFCIEIGDLFYQAFPETRNIFLYRNAEDYAISALRAFGGDEADRGEMTEAQANLSQYVPAIPSPFLEDAPMLTEIDFAFNIWVQAMQGYIDLSRAGMLATAVRYEDIKEAPRKALRHIISYSEIPESSMDRVFDVLEQDSQAGSEISQGALEKKFFRLAAAHQAELKRMLAAQPIVRRHDYVVPQTWKR